MKVDGGQSSSSTRKTTLLQQLGLEDILSSSEGSSGEEKTDNQAEGEKKEESDGVDGVDPFLPPERPLQKNKKKCWICKSKLELAQRELGTCKCGEYTTYLFPEYSIELLRSGAVVITL